jgi:hypothetical protein
MAHIMMTYHLNDNQHNDNYCNHSQHADTHDVETQH